MKNIIKKIYKLIIEINKDYLFHFIAGLVISEIVIVIISSIFHSSYGGCIAGFVVAFAIGIAKEIYDKHHEGHSIKFKDFLSTTAGIILGSLLMFLAII